MICGEPRQARQEPADRAIVARTGWRGFARGNLMTRRTMLRVGLCAGLSLACAMSIMVPAASAQDKWPSRRVTIVVPFAAGSNTDACARLLAELLRDIHGQPFIVENRGGAGGTLGANAVAKSAPDGYTLLMAGNTSLSAAPALVKNVPYDPIKDFTAIARVGRFSSVLVTTPAAAVPDHAGIREPTRRPIPAS